MTNNSTLPLGFFHLNTELAAKIGKHLTDFGGIGKRSEQSEKEFEGWAKQLPATSMNIKETENPAMYAIVGRISLTTRCLSYSIVSVNYAITML